MPLPTANKPPNNEKLIEDLRRNLKRARENTEPFQVPTSADRYVIDYTRPEIEIEMTENEYLSANDGNDENFYYSGDAIYGNDEIMDGNTLNDQDVIYNNEEPIYGNI
jgi:phage repressor protein C with HTH and peptisase S24 domain